MKKFILSIIIIITVVIINRNNIVIPDEAIRVRVIANSNSSLDQSLKKEVAYNVEDELYYLLKDVRNVESARNLVKENMSKIDKRVSDTLLSKSNHMDYRIDYGYNYFPSKEYKGIKYKDGMYESLVVTLGEGKGENWWCVMFPPFCLIEAHDEGKTDIEYKFAVKELLNKYFD